MTKKHIIEFRVGNKVHLDPDSDLLKGYLSGTPFIQRLHERTSYVFRIRSIELRPPSAPLLRLDHTIGQDNEIDAGWMLLHPSDMEND